MYFTRRGRQRAALSVRSGVPPNREAARLDQDHTSIRHDHLPGYVVGVGRGQESRDTRQIRWLRRKAEQDARREALDELAFLLDDALVDHVLLEAIPERRHHHPGRKRVDCYLMLAELARGGLGQRDNGSLARAIGSEFRIALSSRDRGGVDDLAAASLGHHLAGRFLCADKHSEGVDAHDAVEVVFVDVHEGKRLVETGVVEHDVQPAETLDSSLNRISHLLPFGNIESHGNCRFVITDQAVRYGLGFGAVDVRNHDRGAFLSQSPSDALAETLSAAGDDHDLAVKTIHCVSSLAVNPAVRNRTYSGDPWDYGLAAAPEA